MSYLSQMGALAVQNFVSAAVGIAVAVALIRGISRRGAKTIGNFWVDVVRCTCYVLLPIAFVFALVFIAQGALQTLAGPAHIHDALNGVGQVIPRGPVASQETIKQLGTNGGGFFNANGADPFENPTGLTNFLSVVLILCHPGRADLHVRQDGRQRPAGCRDPRRDGDPVRRLARHRVGVRAPRQPGGGGRRRRPSAGRQHDGQGGSFRRHLVGAVRDRLDADLDRQRGLRGGLLHADGRLRGAHRHDARRGVPGRRRQRPVHDLAVRDHHGIPRRAHGRSNTGVPRQEDPGQGGEAGDLRRSSSCPSRC